MSTEFIKYEITKWSANIWEKGKNLFHVQGVGPIITQYPQSTSISHLFLVFRSIYVTTEKMLETPEIQQYKQYSDNENIVK